MVLKVHAPTKNKSNDTKDTFFEEVDVFNQFLKYHMIILLGDFNTKVGRNIFKQQSGMRVK
jgi:hypothetical protein